MMHRIHQNRLYKLLCAQIVAICKQTKSKIRILPVQFSAANDKLCSNANNIIKLIPASSGILLIDLDKIFILQTVQCIV